MAAIDRSSRDRVLSASFLVGMWILLFALLAGAQVPTPHGVAGYIYESNGVTQVSTGTPFRVSDLNSSYIIEDATSVPVPVLSGRYSVSIDGSDGDTILVESWKTATYGETSVILSGDMDNVNVIFNLTRPPEPNVTIYNPSDNSFFNISSVWQLNLTFSLLGGSNGIGCNVTLNISNDGAFDIYPGETYVKYLGNVNLGVIRPVSFNITGVSTGGSNFTVFGRCQNTAKDFSDRDNDTLYNISSAGISEPVPSLVYPPDDTQVTHSYNVTFTYYIGHPTGIANCSLLLDGVINQTHASPATYQNYNFTAVLNNGTYDWTVSCEDVLSNIGEAGGFNLSIYVHPPAVQSVSIIPDIALAIGSLVEVDCNSTVTDLNGAEDIISVNATLRRSGFLGGDSPNDQYTNASCSLVDSGLMDSNYTCRFSLWYFASNGTWECDVGAADNSSLASSNINETFIQDLVAFGVDESIVYGTVSTGGISDQKNVTVQNLGNINASVWVNGYGAVPEDNLSMVCEESQSIPISNEHFSGTPLAYLSMQNLSSNITLIENFGLPKRVELGTNGSSKNSTFWSIMVPAMMNPASCNGSVTFYASIQ